MILAAATGPFGGFFSSPGGVAVFVISLMTLLLLFGVLAQILRLNRFLRDILPPTSPFVREKKKDEGG